MEPITVTTTIELHMTDVVSVSQGLAAYQVAAWATDGDFFALFVTAATWICVFGVLSILTNIIARATWRRD